MVPLLEFLKLIVKTNQKVQFQDHFRCFPSRYFQTSSRASEVLHEGCFCFLKLRGVFILCWRNRCFSPTHLQNNLILKCLGEKINVGMSIFPSILAVIELLHLFLADFGIIDDSE